MNFDANFRLSFIQSLRKNKELFYDVSRERLSPLQNEMLTLAYYNRAVAYATIDDLNIEAVWDDFSICLHKNNFPIQERCLYFFYSASNSEAEEDDDIIQYLRNKTAALEHKFWANASMVKLYNELAEFSCFEDRVIPENIVEKKMQKWHYANAGGWCDYYFRMLQQFIPEYSFSEKYSDKKVARFLSDLGNGCHLGFELYAANYKTALEGFHLFAPEFRIILINEGFKKSIKEEAYWPMNGHAQIVVISDQLENPYFPGLLNNLSVVFSRILLDNTASFIKMVKVKEGVQIIHDKELGQLLQRVAFYHFYLTINLIKPYLEYLAYAVKNIENKVSDDLIIEKINSLEERNKDIAELIKEGEALLAQMKAQNAAEEYLEYIKRSLEGLETERAENTKNIKQLVLQCINK